MSYAFREYLTKKSFGDFLSMTQKEAAEYVTTQTALLGGQKDSVIRVLQSADQIKYAGVVPDQEYWNQMNDLVQQFVEEVEVV